MKNTSLRDHNALENDGVDNDGVTIPPAQLDFDIGNFFRLSYFQMTTNAKGLEYHFLYFKKQLTDKERSDYCIELCTRNLWRMVRLDPAAQIVE